MRKLIAAGLFGLTLVSAAAMAADGCANAQQSGEKGCEAAANASDPAAYKPQTEYDNTPWRFDMSQNGKRMTADEFDAWMKARGGRGAKGAPAPAATASAPATESAAAPTKD